MSQGFQNQGGQGNLAGIFGGNGFDTSTAPPDIIPPCKPLCLVEKADMKRTAKGNGHYINVQLTVQEDPYRGKKLFDQINIDNPSQKAVEIGLRQFAALGKACGVPVIEDTNQLVGKACRPHVNVHDDQNVIKGYSAPEQAAVPGAPQQPNFQPPAQPQGPPQQPQYQQPVYQQPVQQPQYQQQTAPPQQTAQQSNQGDGVPIWRRQ